jgi:hypothetical protein
MSRFIFTAQTNTTELRRSGRLATLKKQISVVNNEPAEISAVDPPKDPQGSENAAENVEVAKKRRRRAKRTGSPKRLKNPPKRKRRRTRKSRKTGKRRSHK